MNSFRPLRPILPKRSGPHLARSRRGRAHGRLVPGRRLPRSRLRLFPGDRLQAQARAQAGIRVVFETDTTSLAGRFLPFDQAGTVDLVVDDALVGSTSVGPDGTFAFPGLPGGAKVVELWLPQTGDFRLAELAVDTSARIWATPESGRPRLITYGSSITHAGGAESAARTWPALVARELGMDLSCLGFGGECHLDPMIARLVRDLPADLVIACLGINVYGAGSFTRRSFLPAVLGFVSTIRDGHPGVPILVMSPIFSPSREDQAGSGGMTLKEMRGQVLEAGQILRDHGDLDVHPVDGVGVLGPAQVQHLPDGLHPDAAGNVHMATKITPLADAHLQDRKPRYRRSEEESHAPLSSW